LQTFVHIVADALIQENTYIGKDAEKAQKQELYNKAFGERQQQYEQMFAKPPVPEINFTEKNDDHPISNMDELIERHKKERESELTKFSPLKEFLPQNSQPLPPPSIIVNNNQSQLLNIPPISLLTQQSNQPLQQKLPQQQSSNIYINDNTSNNLMSNDNLYLKNLVEKQNTNILSLSEEIKGLYQKMSNMEILFDKLINKRDKNEETNKKDENNENIKLIITNDKNEEMI
jgi:hypothetical protein